MDDDEGPSNEFDVLNKASSRVDLTQKLHKNNLTIDVREKEFIKNLEEYGDNIEKYRLSPNKSPKNFRIHKRCFERKMRYLRITTYRKLCGDYLPALGFYFTGNPHLSKPSNLQVLEGRMI